MLIRNIDGFALQSSITRLFKNSIDADYKFGDLTEFQNYITAENSNVYIGQIVYVNEDSSLYVVINEKTVENSVTDCYKLLLTAKDLDAVNAALTDLSTKVTTNTTKLTELETSLNNTKDRLTEVNNTLDAKITVNSNAIATLRGNIDSIENDIEALEAQLDGIDFSQYATIASLSTYATKKYVDDAISAISGGDVGGLVTDEELAEALASYLTTAAASQTYQTKQEFQAAIADYLTKADAATTYATKSELQTLSQRFETVIQNAPEALDTLREIADMLGSTEGLSQITSLLDEINQIKQDLAGLDYLTQEDLNTALAGYAQVSDLEGLVSTEDLAGYATTQDIANFVTANDVQSAIETAMEGYTPSSSVEESTDFDDHLPVITKTIKAGKVLKEIDITFNEDAKTYLLNSFGVSNQYLIKVGTNELITTNDIDLGILNDTDTDYPVTFTYYFNTKVDEDTTLEVRLTPMFQNLEAESSKNLGFVDIKII